MSELTTLDAVTTLKLPARRWETAGWGSVESASQSFATREVIAIAALPETRDSVSADAARMGIASKAIARDILNSAAAMVGCDALELRYETQVDPGIAPRTRMYVSAKSSTSGQRSLAAAAVDNAVAALGRGFTTVPVHSLAWAGRQGAIVELRRREVVSYPEWAYVPADYYYAPVGSSGDGSGWSAFWDVLARLERAVEVSLLFRRTKPDPIEEDVLGSVLTHLSRYADGRTETDFLGNASYYPPDANARTTFDSWNTWRTGMHQPFLTRVSVRAELPEDALRVAAALNAAISQRSDGSSIQPLVVEIPRSPEECSWANDAFDWLEVHPWGGPELWEYEQAPHRLRRAPFLWGIDDAAGLAVLPVPDTTGAPGFPRQGAPESTPLSREPRPAGPNITLGSFLNHGADAEPALLPLSAINRHVLIVGSPGGGKSTTVFTTLLPL